MAGRGVNKVILVGNLGADPEVRVMPSGDSVANLSVATNDSWKDRNTGEQRDRTEWHRVVIIFGKLADVARQYLRKGSKVYLEGRLQTRKWTDQNGMDRYTTEVVVDITGTMVMLDSRSDAGQTANFPDQYQPGPNSYQAGQAGSTPYQASPAHYPAATPPAAEQPAHRPDPVTHVDHHAGVENDFSDDVPF